MSERLKCVVENNLTGQTQTPVQTYTYTYDRLNRLKRAAYSGASNKQGHYNEELAYDVMGNIDTLRRTNGGTGWHNHFKYSYTGNQLTGVSDAGTAQRTNSFSYDANGNGKSNSRLGITNIEYNYLNLPKRFVKGTESLVYTYDATGQKLTKTHGTAVTQYVDGIQYKNGVIEFIQTEEGRIVPNGSSFVYEYFLTDHLGNTRAIVDHTGAVKQIQDYYAFGMEMNPGSAYNSGVVNNYRYNGKEKQAELGLDQLEYGARFYDAEIARFNVIDRFAEKYYSMTPYQYGGLDPIKHIDVNGDSLYVTHRTGFLGLGGKQTLRYEGGNLYNQDGSSYTGKVKGFLKQTVNALGNLNSTAEGASMVSELESSNNSFTIQNGKNSFIADNRSNAGANLTEVQAVTGNTAGSSGSGGTIFWNPASRDGGLDLTGGTARPAYIGLGHEMAHASDANQGLLHFGNMSSNPRSYTNAISGITYYYDHNGLLKSEWRAVYRENIIRGQAGIPLRTHYGYDVSTGVPVPTGPRLLTPANLPINYR